jgi:hypothetical protein
MNELLVILPTSVALIFVHCNYWSTTANKALDVSQWMKQLSIIIEICGLLDYYAAESGNSVPTFRDNLSAPSSWVKTSKKILVNNQLGALFLCIYLFHFSTCFEQPSAHNQENQFYQYIFWYISLCVGDCLVCR